MLVASERALPGKSVSSIRLHSLRLLFDFRLRQQHHSSKCPYFERDGRTQVRHQRLHNTAARVSRAEPSASAMAKTRSSALYGASAAIIEEALRKLDWTPIGNRTGSVKGVRCTTVLAKRDGMNAEVKSFYGYPYQLKDMLELEGTAQGLGEMTMITVIVKSDPAKTDELYEQLMGSTPMRHGSGLGQ